MSAAFRGLMIVFVAIGLVTLTPGELVANLHSVLSSTPVLIITMLVIGQWGGELTDALFFKIEGGEGGALARYLRWRIAFTRRLLRRPFWYPNEDRIGREIARTSRALLAAGFAPLDNRESIDVAGIAQDVDYLVACSALIKAMGVRKAARFSAAVRRRSVLPVSPA